MNQKCLGGLDDENKDEDGRLKGEGEGGSSEQRLPLKKRHHHVQVILPGILVSKTYFNSN